MSNLRWSEGLHKWQEGRIETARHYVADLAWGVAKAFIERHHYSRRCPSMVERFGLYRKQSQGPDMLVGVAAFSVSSNPLVTRNVFGDARAAELGRLVLLDFVEGNAESWMVARCFEALRRRGYAGILSFSDPVPRTAADGREVFCGHVGCVYQALNAVRLGRSKAQTLSILPGGTVFSEECKSKIRRMVRGWQYASRILRDLGADEVWADRPKAWLAHWLPILTRPLRHPGNFRYAWGLDRRHRRALPPGDPYPKRGGTRVA